MNCHLSKSKKEIQKAGGEFATGVYANDGPFMLARAFRDLSVIPIFFSGTNEIMKSIIAKSMNL